MKAWWELKLHQGDDVNYIKRKCGLEDITTSQTNLFWNFTFIHFSWKKYKKLFDLSKRRYEFILSKRWFTWKCFPHFYFVGLLALEKLLNSLSKCYFCLQFFIHDQMHWDVKQGKIVIRWYMGAKQIHFIRIILLFLLGTATIWYVVIWSITIPINIINLSI